MITCFVDYQIDPYQIPAFEEYAKAWIPLIERFGGIHHGYFLPSEGSNDRALTLFSFPSFAAYEEYREKTSEDPECQAAFRIAEETRCIKSYQRSFFRPVGI